MPYRFVSGVCPSPGTASQERKLGRTFSPNQPCRFVTILRGTGAWKSLCPGTGTLRLFVAACLFYLPSLTWADFISGADFSLLAYFQNCGVVYKDASQPQDALVILKNHGLTCVRLRLFTSSAAQASADPYNYTNNLAYT